MRLGQVNLMIDQATHTFQVFWDRTQMRFAAMDEETGMRGFYRGIGCRRRRCPGCTPAWSCAALPRPLLDGAPLRIDICAVVGKKSFLSRKECGEESSQQVAALRREKSRSPCNWISSMLDRINFSRRISTLFLLDMKGGISRRALFRTANAVYFL